MWAGVPRYIGLSQDGVTEPGAWETWSSIRKESWGGRLQLVPGKWLICNKTAPYIISIIFCTVVPFELFDYMILSFIVGRELEPMIFHDLQVSLGA